jgi:AcrR family transcriptional regulator
MSSAQHNRRRRGELTRDEIVTAALAIIDAEGLDALTMRRLAGEIACGLTTLYSHVWDRGDLLNGVVARVLAEIDFRYIEGDTWADVLLRTSNAYRSMAQRHPHAFALVAASPVDRPPVVDHLFRATEVLVKTGISTESAFELLAVNDAFATGLFVTDAATKAPASSASPRDVQTALGETQMRFRDYAGDRIWEQGMKMIIAGAQLTLGLPPV